MFLKLFKFELKSNYRGFLLLYAVLLASSCLIGFGNLPGLHLPSVLEWAINLVFIVYVGAIISVWILTLVNIIKGYATSMFKRPAYLTHTLPVPTWQTLLVKLLSSCVWMILTTFVVFISLMVMMLMAANYSNISFSDILDLFSRIHITGDDIIQIISMLVVMSVQFLEGILLFYFVLNVVHSSYVQRARVAIAVAFIIFLTYMQSYLMNFLVNTITPSYGTMGMWFSTILYIALGVAFFFGSVYLLDHKMEVE